MSMDRPILLPWWRKKLWLQLGIAAIVALLLITVAVLFLGTAQRSLRVSSSSVTVSGNIDLKSEAVRGFSFEPSSSTSVTYGP